MLGNWKRARRRHSYLSGSALLALNMMKFIKWHRGLRECLRLLADHNNDGNKMAATISLSGESLITASNLHWHFDGKHCSRKITNIGLTFEP